MKGKNILVVGGTSGIGNALVHQLVKAEANVWVAARNHKNLPLEVNYIELDVLNLGNQLDQLPEHLHGLVYCPGSINLRPFNRLTEADFKSDFEINVVGGVKIVQTCFKKLKASGNASIVFFSTVAVQTGMSFHASVAVSKGAIEGLTKSLAAEMAPNVRVNCIAPSLTETPLASTLLSTPEKKEASDKRHPLGRIGQPDDIASTARFLLSDESSWMTGQIIHLDGGMSSLK